MTGLSDGTSGVALIALPHAICMSQSARLPLNYRRPLRAKVSPERGDIAGPRTPGQFTDAKMVEKCEEVPMSDDYARGRRDGLRLALNLLAAEEAKWWALLGESKSWRTNAIREVRHKTLQVAQTRVQTTLNRLKRNGDTASNDELVAAVEKAGL